MFEFSSTILWRELQIAMQRKGAILATLLFYCIILSLFLLLTSANSQQILWLVPGFFWIAALLSQYMAQENSFRDDFNLGIFEQCIVSGNSLCGLVFSKILGQWLLNALPLILITPILAQLFAMPLNSICVLCVSLGLGTPSLSMIAALGSAITISLPQGGVMLAIIVLPLYLPILILGCSATMLSIETLNYNGQLALLAALSMLSLLFVPLAISTAIKASIAC